MKGDGHIGLAGFAILLLCSVAGLATAQSGTGSVEGTLSVGYPGLELSQVSPIVIFLVPLDPEVETPPREEAVSITQKNARFIPDFKVVGRGQLVDMPNLDSIYHNVFSFSPGNEFDLGMYPAGQSRSVKFDHAGVVRTYCSIHESMNATIFVAPTRYFTTVRKSGAFVIRGVPPGRYRLETWCERLPAIQREVVVGPEGVKSLRISLAEVSASP